MINKKLVRTTLWLSVPFNIVAGINLMYPDTAMAALFGLSGPVPPFYAFFLGGIIISFGLIYGWLAQSAEINRAVLTISTLGKISVFVLAAGLWLTSQGALETMLVTVVDLAFGITWGLWLLKKPND